MKSGSRTLDWDTPIPQDNRQIHRRHEPTYKNANLGLINRCAKEPVGPDKIRAVDFDTQDVPILNTQGIIVDYIEMGFHWESALRNGYRFIIDDKTGKRRHMRPGELRRASTHQGYDQVRKWRRKNGERPVTIDEAIKHGVDKGVVVVPEKKSPSFAIPERNQKWIDACKLYGHPAWCMALLKMVNAEGKNYAVQTVGGQFALIFGKFVRQARTKKSPLTTWRIKPNAIWQPKSAAPWARS